MSSRQRKRLMQQQQLGDDQETNNSEQQPSEDEEDEEVADAPKARNAFAFLSDSEEDESSSSEEDEKQQENATVVEQAKPPPAPMKQDDEDALLDEAVKQAAQEKESGERGLIDGQECDVTQVDFAKLFEIDRRSLNPSNELKRQFGQAIASHGEEGAAAARELDRQRGVRGRNPHGSGRIQRLRQPVLAQPDDNWVLPPSFNTGDGARMVQLEDGTFTFEASTGYQEAQEMFQRAKQSADPNMLVEVLNKYPFHVDTLLQLSEVYMATSNFETAQLMLRRALVALESWLHPSFRSGMLSGHCRLLIEEFEEKSRAGLNFALVRAVFKSMQTSSRRGCYDTAFNLAKLVFKFEPALDPKCVLLCLDYYTLNVQEPEFLVSFIQSSLCDTVPLMDGALKSCIQLPQLLPNMAYAYAMAHRMRGNHDAEVFLGSGNVLGTKSAQPDTLSSLEKYLMEVTSDNPHPDLLLRAAILRFPGVVVQLAKQLGNSLVPLDQSPWKAIVEWCETAESCTTTENLPKGDRLKLYMLYAARSSSLWKSGPQLIKLQNGTHSENSESTVDWLKRVAKGMLAEFPSPEAVMNEVRELLKERETPLFVAEHLCSASPADFTDDLESLPALEEMVGAARAPAPQPNVDLDQNALALFFQTLLPWARVPARDPNAN